MQPVCQILFSWVYFFVGFAKTHYVIFSYIGGGIILGGFVTLVYFPNVQFFIENKEYMIFGCISVTIGAAIAYPDIFPKIFPNIVVAWQEMIAWYQEMNREKVVLLPDLQNEGENQVMQPYNYRGFT